MHKECAAENTLLFAFSVSLFCLSVPSSWLSISFLRVLEHFFGLTNLLKYIVSLSINIAQFTVRPENGYSSLFRNSFITLHPTLTRPSHSPLEECYGPWPQKPASRLKRMKPIQIRSWWLRLVLIWKLCSAFLTILMFQTQTLLLWVSTCSFKLMSKTLVQITLLITILP